MLQGLYEYVRPSWEERLHPAVGELDMKSFGNTTPDRPTSTDNATMEVHADGTVLPASVSDLFLYMSKFTFCNMLAVVHTLFARWQQVYIFSPDTAARVTVLALLFVLFLPVPDPISLPRLCACYII